MKKKLLITGFDPFGGESVNPAFEAVRLLPDEIAGFKLCKLEIPTEFIRSGVILKGALRTEQPDTVLCVGQAVSRTTQAISRSMNLSHQMAQPRTFLRCLSKQSQNGYKAPVCRR